MSVHREIECVRAGRSEYVRHVGVADRHHGVSGWGSEDVPGGGGPPVDQVADVTRVAVVAGLQLADLSSSAEHCSSGLAGLAERTLPVPRRSQRRRTASVGELQ